MQCLFGTQAYDGDFHQNGYTELLLRHELREAGFGKADFAPFCEWLFDVVATKCEPDSDLRLEDCIFMTLERPSEVAARHLAGQPNATATEPTGDTVAIADTAVVGDHEPTPANS